MRDEFRDKNLQGWDDLLNNIFHGQIPESRSWTEKKRYNKYRSIDDGRHSKMTEEEFKEYIGGTVRMLSKNEKI